MIKKIKIIHVLQSLEVGGLENGVVNIANHLDDNEFEVVICCVRRLGPLAERLKQNIKVLCLKEKSGYSILRVIRLLKIFKNESPQVVHTHGWGSDYFSSVLAAKLAGVPIIINGEHGVLYLDNKLRVFAQRILPCFLNKILTVSYSLKDELVVKLGLPADKIFPIINGVDTEAFISDINLRSKIRHDFGISNQEIVVGTVGRLVSVKNYELLISAANELCNKYKNLKFIIVGDGPLRDKLELKAKELKINKSIVFVGSTDKVLNFLNLFDIFTLTSFTEGLSNTILEAMSCGKPIIASDVGDNGKIIKHAENGFIFKSNDLAELVRWISILVEDSGLRLRFGDNARASVVANFSLQGMINNYAKFYIELLKNRVK